jgi:uroporphyrinogen decarboxylase
VFPRAAGANYPRYAETKATAISLDAHTSLEWARQQFKPNVALQGNLDPLALIAGGKALTNAVDRILADTRGTPHIFNLGHGIRPETPIAHVEQLLAHIRGAHA